MVTQKNKRKCLRKNRSKKQKGGTYTDGQVKLVTAIMNSDIEI